MTKTLEQISIDVDKINFDDNKFALLDGSAEIVLVPYKLEISNILEQSPTYEIWVKKDEKDPKQKITKIGDYIVPGSYEFIGFKKK